MNKMTRALVGLIMTAVTLPAFAQATEMRPYASVMYDTVFSDSDRDAKNGKGFTVGVGAAINKYWGVEVSGFSDKAKADGFFGHDWREIGGKVDGLFFYSRNPSFSPYVGLGLGGMKNERRDTGDKSTNFFADAGLGFFKYFPIGSYDIAFRADARYRWVNANKLPPDALGNGNSFGEPIVKVGLVFPFGKRAGAAAAAAGAAGAAAAGNDKAGAGAAKGYAFENVYFEFDQSDLDAKAQTTLDAAAGTINELTQKYPSLKVDLSGNTDWIGTEGYNQALSERRADTVKQYLTRKGVEAGRITTHAYGEAKPVANNETAEGRALNRRVEIKTDAPAPKK